MRPELYDGYADASGREIVRRPGWFSKLLPAPLARRAFSATLIAPDEFVVGEPRRFALRVKNRFPAPISLTVPSARVWGWAVDGHEEADARALDPPDGPRTVAFANLETRTFVGRWDGCLRQDGPDGDRWDPLPGERRLSAYLATEPRIGAEKTVRVRER